KGRQFNRIPIAVKNSVTKQLFCFFYLHGKCGLSNMAEFTCPNKIPGFTEHHQIVHLLDRKHIDKFNGSINIIEKHYLLTLLLS
ncbi:MAG: hypothetical protein RL632_87, partial [Bacteroidota bacterium]